MRCVKWNGKVNSRGYGYLWHKGRNRVAHAVAWETANGIPVPGGMEVCHRCDNPLCVNPEHLFVATHAQNMRDCADKGRRTLGELSAKAKLNWRKAGAIRALWASGWSLRQIGRRYGVDSKTVHAIVRLQTWRPRGMVAPQR